MSENVCGTNRVDILGDDGLFRSGRVVDVADYGLFVDFLTPSRRREFTPFSRVFQNAIPDKKRSKPSLLADAYTYAKPDVTIPVDVLMPETPFGPWVWFPAGIVNVSRGIRHTDCSIAVVQWVHGVPSTDLVSLDRLRWKVSRDWWATVGRKPPVQLPSSEKWHDGGSQLSGLTTVLESVVPGVFEKHSVSLPQDCRHIDADKLLQHLNEKASRQATYNPIPVFFVDVIDGNLSYLWRNPPKAPGQETPSQVLSRLDRRHDALFSTIRQINSTLPKESAFCGEPEEINDISLITSAVLLEVFSHLDTRTQTGLRSVCFGWSSLLESPLLTTCIIVGTSHNDYQANRIQRHYILTSPIFRFFCKSTQRIVIDGRREKEMNTGDFVTVTDMIHYMGRKTESRVPTIYVVGVEFDLQFGYTLESEQNRYRSCETHRAEEPINIYPFTYRLVDFIAACSDLPCDTIHMVRCTMELNYAELEDWKEIQLWVDLSGIRLPMRRDMSSAVWDEMENDVPMPSSEELDTLSGWLTFIGREKVMRRERGLACRTLCATQTADPRPSAHYRGKKWCADGLRALQCADGSGHLQLKKLSSIALHFLAEMAEFWMNPDDSDNFYYNSDSSD
ncbi:uncharacterized protein LOC129589921 [Paramacrobiotus metropolitanus]|uniref:uncharacterized protein LOC129589921 n=1 Tax=Paramacrobiotus metropolitanus TaxID=2943436 RepID=UPI00244614A2|nr:uncharacterized protein LOC129589921 [Paramacrobiotus metropolitanus]XP_055340825.1 uncharacterized protein LOC129589921 [Paramacrobiotus metropolitanus]XP_055340826.1 uncharacterized protein LOC129589921 [Paramacrobiotus metropolitanus]XP_055340827.1 uncharacterized protein LOC129589921 [Paramacrobiotus metropolitanus]XP_055340828.1 uncharacterized protein LOC129589921 [Paramacrobiotus metropolitanus]